MTPDPIVSAISAAIGYKVGITTPVVELTHERMPELAAIIGVAVCSFIKLVRKSEIKVIPPSSVITFTRSPTPTIRIKVPQGIPLIAFFSSTQPRRTKTVAAAKAKSPVSSLNPMQQITTMTMAAIVVL